MREYQPSSFSDRLRFAWWDLRDRRADRGHAGPVRRRGPLRAAFAVTVVAVVAGTALLATGGAIWGSGSASGGGNGGPTGAGSAPPGGGSVPPVEPAAHRKRDERRRRKRPRIVAGARAESETPGKRVSEGLAPSSPPPARSTPPAEPDATPAPPTPSPPVTSQPSPPPQGEGGGDGGDGGGGTGGSGGVHFDDG